jgi:hypothetical protein
MAETDAQVMATAVNAAAACSSEVSFFMRTA